MLSINRHSKRYQFHNMLYMLPKHAPLEFFKSVVVEHKYFVFIPIVNGISLNDHIQIYNNPAGGFFVATFVSFQVRSLEKQTASN